MASTARIPPWLTPGDRMALVAVTGALVLLLGVGYASRAGFGRNEAELLPAPPVASHVIDINRADWWELQALRGIGEKKAKDIVAHRARHGPFETVDHLADVPGLGAKTVERLRPHLIAGRPEGAHGRPARKQ